MKTWYPQAQIGLRILNLIPHLHLSQRCLMYTGGVLVLQNVRPDKPGRTKKKAPIARGFLNAFALLISEQQELQQQEQQQNQ